MSLDPAIREEAYVYFLSESQDLLRTVENELFQLREDPNKGRIHALMRATHTLKGASANVGLETIQTIAHHMEDVFRALFEPEAVVDLELEGLLLELYDCLRVAMTAELENEHQRDEDVLAGAIDTFAKIQGKLGDCFGRETVLPTSSELGFDIVLSIFESGVLERIEQLAAAIAQGQAEEMAQVLAAQVDVFIGLGESLGLPGFVAIAQAVGTGLAGGVESAALAQAALDNWTAAREAVLAGDRTHGGEVSAALAELVGLVAPSPPAPAAPISQPLAQALRSNIAAVPSEAAGQAAPVGASLAEPEESSEVVDLSDDDLSDLNLETMFGDLALGGSAEGAATPAPPATPVPVQAPELVPSAVPPVAVQPVEIAPQPAELVPAATAAPPPAPASQRVDARPLGAAVPLIRVELDRLQELQHLVGELLINENRQSLQDEQLRLALNTFRMNLRQHQRSVGQLCDQIAEQERHSPSAPSGKRSSLGELAATVREQATRLEDTTEVVDRYAQQTNQTMEKQRRLLGNVRDSLMEARMQPISVVFDRFPPLVRQLSARYSKAVELRRVGDRVSIDKQAIEHLYDPLLHLVRNAFDHGIEPLEVRRQRGKPDVGTIELRAQQQGNQVLVSVADDGGGIDPERVRQKAIERGLLSPEAAAQATPSALFDLLFEPGFSTARQVTDLSGRGVGLDVVKSQLQSLKGSVGIQSVPGQGTVFLLRVPLSLMTARLLICQSDRAAYALPSDNISQILIPQPHQTQLLGGQRVLRWHPGGESGEITIPIRKLSDMVQYPTMQPRRALPSQGAMAPFLSNRLAPLLLLEGEGGLVAIEVEGVVGEQELVLRQLSEAIPSPSYIYGCTILGDGRMVLVVDGQALLAHADVAPAVTGAARSGALPAPVAAAIAPSAAQEVAKVAAGSEAPRLAATPAPGGGASLVEQAAVAQTVPSNSAPAGSTAKTLLVIEDSETERRVVSRSLEAAGYRVLQAAHGREALSVLQQTPQVDLVISDLEMPIMGGLEFLNARRQLPQLGHIPVVMLTSCSGKQYRQVATSLGATGYLTKPMNLTELLGEIERRLGSVAGRPLAAAR